MRSSALGTFKPPFLDKRGREKMMCACRCRLSNFSANLQGGPSSRPMVAGAGHTSSVDPLQQVTLESSWTLWFDRVVMGVSYESRLQRLGAFNSAQSFWAYYCHLARPSQLRAGDNLHMLRGFTPPAFEASDPSCRICHTQTLIALTPPCPLRRRCPMLDAGSCDGRVLPVRLTCGGSSWCAPHDPSPTSRFAEPRCFPSWSHLSARNLGAMQWSGPA